MAVINKETTACVNSRFEYKDKGASKRLILGPVKSDFDPDKDVPIGPWCFYRAEEIYPNWEELPFLDVYSDSEKLNSDSDKIRWFTDALTYHLTKIFNDRHGTDYGSEYWRILLLPWVLPIVQALWTRYRHVEEFVDKYSTTSFFVDIFTSDVEWRFYGLREMNAVINSDEFQFLLTSKIVERLAPQPWTLRPVKIALTAPDGDSATPKNNPVKTLVSKLLYDGRCRRVTDLRLSSLFFSLYLQLLPSKKDRRMRRMRTPFGDAASAFPPTFLDLLDEILWKMVPLTLSDSFKEIDDRAKCRRYRCGKMNLVGPVMIYSEIDKFILAHAVEAGERIICSQHGGSGIQKVNINSVAIENSQAAYFSWGWRKQESYDGNIVSVPSPMFSPLKDRHREKDKRLFLVTNSDRILFTRLETAIQGCYAIAHRREKLRFLSALPKPIYEGTHYRPYFGDVGALEDLRYVKKKFPDLSICGVQPRALPGCLLRCRLLVVDHLNTIFFLGMAANIPTIAFCNLDAVQVSKQARPLFDRFADVGVFHSCGSDAAAQAAHVWSDTQGWWHHKDIQEARVSFCDCYARTDRFWWLKWMSALWRL